MIKKYSYILFILLFSVLFLFLSFPSETLKGKRSKDGRYIDHGDGTIMDTNTGLMWTKKDSYADLGKCLDWDDSKSYVSRLTTGGHSDWRMPTVKELESIYEEPKSNRRTFNQGEHGETHLDTIFADRAAYWYWSSETVGSSRARFVYFSRSYVGDEARGLCFFGGVRAMRR